VAEQDFRALINDYGAQVLNTAMRVLGDIHFYLSVAFVILIMVHIVLH